jgi:hypothetical protein
MIDGLENLNNNITLAPTHDRINYTRLTQNIVRSKSHIYARHKCIDFKENLIYVIAFDKKTG